eukprot:TRINITY_DN1640_c1_g1_i1.p1 TRINITY_DN1640_c1_g1~~TRINITY_DN1640_c1_g1_i1.p1  ORF type:complete len:869 (+),score=323.14 TRINITY_DN1640_c1_g1_i1:41-2647(+)
MDAPHSSEAALRAVSASVAALIDASCAAHDTHHDSNTNAAIQDTIAALECVFLHGFRKVTNFFGKPKELLDFLLTAKASCKYVPKLLDAIIKTVPKAKTSKGKARALLCVLLFRHKLEEVCLALLAAAAAIKEFYEPTAFIASRENVDVLIGHLSPVSVIQFDQNSTDELFLQFCNFDNFTFSKEMEVILQAHYDELKQNEKKNESISHKQNEEKHHSTEAVHTHNELVQPVLDNTNESESSRASTSTSTNANANTITNTNENGVSIPQHVDTGAESVELREGLIALAQERDMLRTHIEGLIQQIQIRDADINALSIKITEMDSILRSKEESALATNGEIEKQKIGFENKILELEKSSQQQTQKVQREFEQMNRQISELQRAKSDLSSKLDQKESEFHQTSLKMEAMKSELEFVKEKERISSQGIEKRDLKIKELDKKLKDLESSQKVQMSEYKTSNQELKKEVNSSNAMYAEAKKQLEMVQEEIKSYREKSDVNDLLQKQSEEIAHLTKQLSEKNFEVAQAKESLEQKMKDVDDSKIASLEADLLKARADNDAAEKKVAELAESVHQSKARHEEVTNVLKVEMARLTRELSTASESTSAEIKELKRQNESQAAMLSEANSKMESIRQERDSLANTMQLVTTRSSMLESDLKQTKLLLEQANESIKTLEQGNAVLLEQATAGQAFEKSLHEVTEQYKILEKDFQTEREGKLSLESRIKEIEEAKLQLTSEKQDLEKGISNEKERTRELSSTINSLESELKSKIEELKVQQEGNKFIESTLSQVRTEKEKSESALRSFISQIQETVELQKKQLSEKEKEIANLSKQLEEKKASMDTLRATLVDANKKYQEAVEAAESEKGKGLLKKMWG